MFRDRLHWPDGDDADEAAYAVNVNPGDVIRALDKSRLRVIDPVPVSDVESTFDALLTVEPGDARPRDWHAAGF